jgi:hypothetical protein
MTDVAAGRVCFVLRLKPDRVDEYVAAHEHVWPEMLGALILSDAARRHRPHRRRPAAHRPPDGRADHRRRLGTRDERKDIAANRG